MATLKKQFFSALKQVSKNSVDSNRLNLIKKMFQETDRQQITGSQYDRENILILLDKIEKQIRIKDLKPFDDFREKIIEQNLEVPVAEKKQRRGR